MPREKGLDKIYTAFVVTMTAAMIFFILYMGFVTSASEDDYSLMVEMRSAGSVVGFIWKMYSSWEGRFVSDVAFVFLLKDPKYIGVSVVFIALCFVLTAYLLTDLWQKIFFPAVKKLKYFVFPIMLSGMWLGMRPIIAQTVYWATGGIQYALGTFYYLIWASLIYHLLFKLTKIPFMKLTLPLLMIFSFLAGTGSFTSSPALILFAIIMVVLSGKKFNKNKVVVVSLLSCMVLGTLFLYAAPGNFVRAGEGDGSFSFSIVNMMATYIRVFKLYTYHGRYLLVLSFMGSLAGTIFVCMNTNNMREGLEIPAYVKEKHEQLVLTVSFLITALFSLTPFTVVPDFTPARASFCYQLFLAMFVWGIVSFLFPLLLGRIIGKIGVFMKAGVYLTPVLLSAAVILLAVPDISAGKNVQEQLIERHRMLSCLTEEEKLKDLTVEPVDGPIPNVIYFNDISSVNRYFWINEAVADYYGIKSIMRNSQRLEFEDPKKYF